VLVLALALSAMYLGTGDPNAVLAALGLGWGIGAAVHLVWGSPGGRPTRRQIAAALEELEIPTLDVELAPVQSPSATLMVARDREGPLHVRVLGRDETDAQFWSKAWRWLLYKDSGPELHLTRLSDVEHEAYSLLLAARAGCRVPEVLVAGTAGPGAALLVTRPLEGERLADAGARALTERRLADLWDQLRRLHEAHVGHGALNAHHLIMTSKGIGIDDFSRATGAASDARRGSDIAELLATTAVLVGNDRAVKAAVAGLGREKIASALPFLQTAALSHEMRAHKHHDKKAQADELTQLREAAAKAVRTEAPPLQQLYRVSSTNVLMAVGTLIAVFALLSQVGDPEEFWNTIKNADWAWLVAALGLSFLTNFATAISLSGTVPINLPLLRTAELQLSMSFSNLAVPAIGGMAAQIRFLQKQGVDLASAVASGGLLANVGNIVACTLLFFVALFLSPTSIKTGEIPVDQVIQVVILIAVLIAIALVLIFKIQRLRKLVLPPVTSGAKTIWAAIRSPRRLFQLFGGNILNALMYAAVMMFCLYAFGGEMNYWTLLAINIFVGTIASLVPIPGGGTAVASVGMSGALTAAGISTEIAVAAVLANQLVANFIPAVPGWFATNNLLKDDYL
jgi:undecaprenyl-diphosphatase